MIGAIAGDIIGSVYEFDNIKTTDFPLFTDESDYTDDQQPDQRVVPVVQHAEVKKQVRHDQRCEDADSDHFHRKVFLCTDLFRLHDSRFSFQLFGCQPYGSFDDPP